MTATTIMVLHILAWLFIGVAVMMTVQSSRPECKKLQIVMYGALWPIVFLLVGMVMVISILVDWAHWKRRSKP